MATVGELLTSATARLRLAGSESARLDAELLLGWAIGVERTAVLAHPEAPVGADAVAAFEGALGRREAGEPVAYIRGIKEFYGLAFGVDRRALIPRPETELLVAEAEREVAWRLTSEPRPAGTPRLLIVDVGTGCGAIAIALATLLRRRRMLPEVSILAVDCSADALSLARENAVGHAVADEVLFRESDLLPAAEPAFDLILANLPYIPAAEIDRLPVAASFEPRLALDGGPDGLAFIRRLLAALPSALAPTGTALLEMGFDQGPAVGQVVAGLPGGWTCRIAADLSGRPRLASVERAGSSAAGSGKTDRHSTFGAGGGAS
ncbi:MAG: peptide chain release factor N(5)-glutamine methyltransferase [Candidatus Limnocylindrales bacterium]|jgi:release factor glutamine methyltransferase